MSALTDVSHLKRRFHGSKAHFVYPCSAALASCLLIVHHLNPRALGINSRLGLSRVGDFVHCRMPSWARGEFGRRIGPVGVAKLMGELCEAGKRLGV
jgi:hypothetical protein